MRRFATLAAAVAVALSACADEAPPPKAQETEAPVVTDNGTADDATDAPPDDAAPPEDQLGSDEVMQGQWFAKTERGAPMALFGPPQTEANFLVRCEGDELVFTRSTPIDGNEAEMELRAGGKTRTITTQPSPGPLPQTTGRLPASDPFAAVLAQTTQPIAVRLDEGPFFRMPSHDRLREVVRNCRG
jgi:hypothetical protein